MQAPRTVSHEVASGVLPPGQPIPERLRVHRMISLWRRDPYPGYQALLRKGNVIPSGYGSYIVSGHAAANAVLKDTRFLMPVPFAGMTPHLPLVDSAMVFSNGADHARRRTFMTRAFQPRVLEEMVPRMHQILEELFAVMAKKKTVDVVDLFTLPFPVRVIASMLGVPRDDHARCRVWSEALAPLIDAIITHDGYHEAVTSSAEFRAYVRALMNERRARPADDMISSLTHYLDDRGELTEDEVIANVVTLFIAGHETTTNLLGNTLVLLTEHPEAREALERDPSLLDSAIEESLRFDPPVQSTVRWAGEAVELEGVHIEAGSQMWLMLAGANRDPTKFNEPDRFDIARTPNPHLSFGAGWHFCIGAALARLEARHALSAFFTRFPRWKLVEKELELRDTLNLRGWRRLRVELR